MGKKTTTKVIVKDKDGNAAKNYIVAIYDWDLGKNKELGSGAANKSGEFSVTHEAKQDWGTTRKGRFADIFAKVFTPDGKQRVYRSSVHWNYSEADLEIKAVVDAFETTTNGYITFEDGSPAVGFSVQVWDKDPGKDDLLDETVTNQYGFYSVKHRAKQDWGNIRTGRLGDIYIKVICKKDNITPVKISEPVRKDYSKPFLTINETIPKILATYGANTIYGKVLYKRPDGTTAPFKELKIAGYDSDLLKDDYLGEATTNNDGEFFIIDFTKDDYGLGVEKKPDVYVKAIYNDLEIKRTKTKWNTSLPCNVGMITIPQFTVIGYVSEYKYDGKTRDIGKLIAKLYDNDSIWGGTSSQDQLITEMPLKLEQKFENLFTFSSIFYGTLDRFSASDFYVTLYDSEKDCDVYTSKIYTNQTDPITIKIGTAANPLKIDYIPDSNVVDSPPCSGKHGIIFVAKNYRSFKVYIYRNDKFVFLLPAYSGSNTTPPTRNIEEVEAGKDYSIVAYDTKHEDDINFDAVDKTTVVRSIIDLCSCYENPVFIDFDI